jgi:hypothetical protein
MSASRLQWIVSSCVMGLLAECDSQAGWLMCRIDTGLPGRSLRKLHGRNLPGQVVCLDFPAAAGTFPVLPLIGPFAAETETSHVAEMGAGRAFTEASGSGTRFFWVKQVRRMMPPKPGPVLRAAAPA